MSERIKIDWIGGNCPVQAEGFIAGCPFYFRARGEHWSMSIGGEDVVGDPLWYYEEEYGEWPEAGWMPEEKARGFIAKAASRFLTEQSSPETETQDENISQTMRLLFPPQGTET